MAVRFKGGTQVACVRNLNLLAHAQLEELDIGSRCGGWGECGGDRVRVVSGAEFLSPLSEAEREHLSAVDISRGIRLACQAFPQKDDAEIELDGQFSPAT